MLQITIPAGEQYDERSQEFIRINGCTLQLEHSLVSLSKWESKWGKPFLVKDPKTIEETRDYIRCMTITQNVDPIVYQFVSNENIELVNNYIEAPMTATTFSSMPRRVSALIPSTLQMPSIKEASGKPLPLSHLLTACGVTPSRDANSSCVILRFCLYLQIVSPMLLLILNTSVFS